MTLLSYVIYTVFCILLQLLDEIKFQTTIFNPDLRDGHTATFIKNYIDKLYNIQVTSFLHCTKN